MWIVQYQVRQDGSGNQSTDLIHYARFSKGLYEIYDDGENFLVTFPRTLSRPAEVYGSLLKAKKCVTDAENGIIRGLTASGDYYSATKELWTVYWRAVHAGDEETMLKFEEGQNKDFYYDPQE